MGLESFLQVAVGRFNLAFTLITCCIKQPACQCAGPRQNSACELDLPGEVMGKEDNKTYAVGPKARQHTDTSGEIASQISGGKVGTVVSRILTCPRRGLCRRQSL